jgi:hypothetical protein
MSSPVLLLFPRAMMGEAAALKPYPVHHIHIRSIDPESSAVLWSAAFGAEVTGRARPNGRLRVPLRMCGAPL